MKSTDRIEVDQFVPHPPHKVWRVLVDSELLARWLMPNDFKPIVGHHFTFRSRPMPALNFAGEIHCEVLAIEPERMLRISWVDRSGSGLVSTVTWRLAPEGRGTRLLLEHAGFDPRNPLQRMAQRALGGGWASSVLPALQQVLDEQAAGQPD